MATFVVVGAGMMGSALCVPLADNGHDVRLVGTHLDEAIIASLRSGRRHPKLDHDLPTAVQPYALGDLDQALHGADVIALGVSSAGVGWVCETLGARPLRGKPVFMITKGLALEGATLRVFPDLVGERLGGSPAAVAGPCIAGELARRVPTCVVLAGRDRAMVDDLAPMLSTAYYHVRASTDVVGAEVCAALKNAYAMGVAFGAGLHERQGGAAASVAMHNYESAVFAQASLEMSRVVAVLGGEAATAAGLAGVGDLDVTNNGGRTGRFGRLLGLGLSRDEAVVRMAGATLECLEILQVMRRAIAALEADGRIESGALPLLEHLAEVALDGAEVAVPFERFFR